ncbi:Ig-like domain-containing protein [Candidatus Palauibacter sp.]|uniref:Ig-like domain-containing protein n=1 Tax=Candidatus Palauibacter sp. TaxID=3101350 RepID=UPI003D09B6AB
MQVASGNTSAVTVSPKTLTFTSANYNTRQHVTYTGVDDNIRNQPPAHRSATVTYTATGANYDGISHSVTVLAIDDEPMGFAVTEGFSYNVNFAYLVEQGCAPATIDFVASDSTLLGLSPQSHSWNEQDSNRQKAVRATFHHNNAFGDHRVSLERRVTVPCGRPFPFQEIIFIVRDNDTWDLSVKGVPACGATVTDTSVQPQIDFLLKPAPAVEMATEYRPISEDNSERWQGSLPIGTSGRSISFSHSPLSSLRRAFPGFKGFEYRLKDAPDVTAQCTWKFEDTGTSSPTVRLSAAPNPVPEGSSVTVTAMLSKALTADVVVPLKLKAVTAEQGDYGPLASITVAGGSMTGEGTITTIRDADTDDETLMVELGSALPPSVGKGSPSSMMVTIMDDGGDDGGDGDTPTNQPPTVTASCDPCTVAPGGEVRLTATASDPDGDALTYAWSAPLGSVAGAADGASARWRAPADTGTVVVSVRVSDGRGGTASATVTIQVANAPPAFGASAYTFELPEGVPGLLDLGRVSAEDPEGQVVTYALAAGGAGRFEIGARDGTVTYTGPGEDYEAEPNRYEFTVTARDPHGAEARARVTVVVTNVNEPPEALADTARTAEDTEVEIGVLANDTDVEGDALTVASVTEPGHGRARIAAGGGGVEYAPGADYHGPDRFTYTVADGNGGTATAEVVVAVASVNDAPEAMADTAATAEDEPVVIDVLANDTDVEGDALTVASVTEPGHGTARIAAGGGGVEYAPGADYHGPDRFTYTVADGNGGTATAEVVVAVASVNDAPEAVGAIPDQALDEGGGPAALDLAPYFVDRDGDPLDYTAVSSDPGVASVTVAGSALTVTPVGYGPASIEVTARDPGGLSATQTFAVNASDRLVRAVLDETLAAMARAHVASARMTLGRRVGSGGADERSRLTVGGRTIPLDGAGVREAAERLLAGWTAPGHPRGGVLAEAGREAGRRLARLAANAADGRGTGGPPGPAELASSLGLTGFGGLAGPAGIGAPGGGGTEFAFVWGGGEAGARDAGGGGRWRLWGQGDLQTFAGDPAPERGYEGDLRTGWAGIDRALGARWLAGVAVARSRGAGDWGAGAADGRLETSLTAVHPYLRWSDGATSLWGMAGGGWGSAENARATGRSGESDLDLRLGLFEIRRRVAGWLGLRADAAWASLATGAGDETVDGRRAAVDQQRLGIELSPSTRLGGLVIEPFAEASARRDGGAGQTGTGLEVAGGLRAASGPVRIDAKGRLLVLHSARGYEERGLGVTLTVGSPAAEEGLSLSVSPRWGGPAAGTGALWNDRHGALRPDAPAGPEPWSLVDARGRWAVRLPGGRPFALSGGLTRSARGYAFTIGGGFEPAGPADPSGAFPAPAHRGRGYSGRGRRR